MEKILAFVCGFSVVVGLCGPKLTKEEEQLLDAMMFLLSKIEDNYQEDEKSVPWERVVVGRAIEFRKVTKNGIFSSDPETNRKMRESSHVRHVFRMSTPEPCVFSIEDESQFSKGESRTEFVPSESRNILNTHTFNLATAHKFVLDESDFRPVIIIQGPRAVCDPWTGCENTWNSFFSGLALGRMNFSPEETARRKRALELIKKSCPGKPF